MKVSILFFGLCSLGIAFAAPCCKDEPPQDDCEPTTEGCDCEPTTKAGCIVPCPKNFDPVCGENSVERKTFSNRCIMNNANCNNDDPYQVVSPGACPSC